MTKVKEVWVSKDKDREGYLNQRVGVWINEPYLDGRVYLSLSELPTKIDDRDFEKINGTPPEPGTKTKIRITTEVI